jgi:hypothetical protein
MNNFNPNKNFAGSARTDPNMAFKAMQADADNGGSSNGGSNNKSSGSHSPTGKPDWRCTQCGKLLGMSNGNQLHIRVQKNREYLVGLPVTANCHGCGTLNRKSAS